MFRNYRLTDKEITKIIKQYENLIKGESIINNKIDEDLSQEIRIKIYKNLKRNRKNLKNFKKMHHLRKFRGFL